MKKSLLIALGSLSCGTVICSWAEPLHDWRDLDGVHSHIVEAIKEMQIASAANSYDMEGHARKAELLLRDAEKELKYAEDSARRAK